MQLDQLICPNCGGVINNVTQDAEVAVCPCCGNEYFVKHAVALSVIEVDKTKDLANLRLLLGRAVDNNNISIIDENSKKIMEIIPNDYSANYCFAYAQKCLNRPAYYKQFLDSECVEATPQEVKKVLVHLIKTSDLRDRYAVESYINKVAIINIAPYIDLHRRTFLQKKRLEENYEILNRDVFVCYRSVDVAIAEKIVQELERDGYKCWISTRNLRPNDSENYWESIQQNIEVCSIFVIVASEDAMVSKDVINEIRIAKNLKKPLVEYKIDQSEHTMFFEQTFDGNKWVCGFENEQQGLLSLRKRVCDELEIIENEKLNQKEDKLSKLEKLIELQLEEKNKLEQEKIKLEQEKKQSELDRLAEEQHIQNIKKSAEEKCNNNLNKNAKSQIDADAIFWGSDSANKSTDNSKFKNLPDANEIFWSNDAKNRNDKKDDITLLDKINSIIENTNNKVNTAVDNAVTTIKDTATQIKVTTTKNKNTTTAQPKDKPSSAADIEKKEKNIQAKKDMITVAKITAKSVFLIVVPVLLILVFGMFQNFDLPEGLSFIFILVAFIALIILIAGIVTAVRQKWVKQIKDIRKRK